MNLLKKFWTEHPFRSILFLALVLRLFSVVYAKGYGMHDDHFLVIEASQSWVDGTDYNNWLPQNQLNPKPEGHSFFYVGIHFLLFSFFKFIGIMDPGIKMYIIRLLHALYSLLAVFYGYKITLKLSNRKTANQVGLFLAALWFMPFLSVRNLVEVVCVPVLMMSFWILINAPEKKRVYIRYLYAGLIMGLAFSIRFQTLFYIAGTGLALFILKKWREALIFGAGSIISICAIQGVVDMFIWHRPFAELTEYVIYNIQHKDAYGTNNPLMYFELIMGVVVPPVGVFLFFGFFRTWKKQILIFLPTFLFFLFHTLFSNKQERFAFTMIPFFIMLGFIGWEPFVEKSKFWLGRKKLLKSSFIFFWVINLLLLPFITTAYSKKSRVEAMYYLYKYKKISSIIVEDTNRNSAAFVPQFYSGHWVPVYLVAKSDIKYEDSCQLIGNARYFNSVPSIGYFKCLDNSKLPDFVLFSGNKNLDQRVIDMKRVFPRLELDTIVESGFIDQIMFKLNPINNNQTFYIYKTKVHN